MRLGDLDEALRMIKDSRKDNPYVSNVNASAWRMAHDSAISCVEAVPTIDAVPVVRCKDCKKTDEGELAGRKFLFCIYPFAMKGVCMITDPNHFCSYGERKDGEG